MPTRPLDRLRDGLLLAVLVVAAASYFLALRGYHFEDAFITFRYAANLAAGEGFVFNPGERVLGTSTPLYALLLAVVGRFGGDPAVAGELLFCVALAAAGGFGALILRRAGSPNAAVGYALAAAWATGGILRFHGMETALYIALLVAMVGAAFAGRTWTTGVLAGLLCLTRYDGVVPVGVLFLELWRRRTVAAGDGWSPPALVRALPWREIVGVTALLGGWLLFAQLYFGDPMPNTLGAKAGSSISALDYAFRAARGQFLDSTTPLLHWSIQTPLALRVAIAAILALAALAGAPGLLRREPRWWTLPAMTLLLLVGYALIGPPDDHRWYHVPGLYVGLLFAAAAAAHFGRRTPPRVACGLAIAALTVSLVAIPATAPRVARLLERGPAARVATYDRFIDWIARHEMVDQVVMTREPGYLTYHTGQRAVDGAGLVTEGIYYHGPADRRSQWHDLVDEYRPGLVVLHAWAGRVEGVFHGRYLQVLQGPPERLLMLERSTIERRAEALADAWRTGTWLASSVLDVPDDATGRVRLASGWAARRALGNRSARGAVWTEPFRIEADEIHVRARGDGDVAIQLLVDGVTVLELDGDDLDAETFRWHAIPTYPWRHRRAEIRIADTDAEGAVEIDGIRWRHYPAHDVLEDFEDGFDARWETIWSDAPTPTDNLIATLGPPAVLGLATASSLGRAGVQTLHSRPFRIDHDRLVLVYGDHADARATISLWVDGERAYQVAGRDRRRLDFLKWDVGPYRGRNAVLVIRDGDPDPAKGLTVDEIVLVSNEEPEP